jgi:hypothetical protein
MSGVRDSDVCQCNLHFSIGNNNNLLLVAHVHTTRSYVRAIFSISWSTATIDGTNFILIAFLRHSMLQAKTPTSGQSLDERQPLLPNTPHRHHLGDVSCKEMQRQRCEE